MPTLSNPPQATIEDFETFGEKIEAGTGLDTIDEMEALGTVKDTLKLLASFQTSMTNDGGVCRAQVKALVDECEVTIDEKYPLQSFTTRVSPQNLTAVTEGIMHRAGSVVVDLIRRAIEVIVKMLKWVAATLRNVFARQRNVHTRVVMIMALDEANREMQSVVGSQRGKPVDEDVTKALQALTEAEGLYRDHYSALAQDLLSNGPLLGAMKRLSMLLPKTAELVADKVDLAESVLKDKPGDRVRLAQQLSTLTMPVPTERLVNATRQLPDLSKSGDLLDFFEKLKTITYQKHDNHPTGQMDWKVAARVVISPQSGFAEPLLAIPDDFLRISQILEEKIERLAQPEVSGQMDASLGASYDAAMMSLVGDVRSLAYYVEAVNLVLDTQATIADCLYRCEVKQFELNRAMGKTMDSDPHVVEAINRIQHSLRDKIIQRR